MTISRWSLLVVTLAVLCACSSSDDDSAKGCLSESEANVCAEASDGDTRISADGLLPGSELLVEVVGNDPEVLQVSDNGEASGDVSGSDPLAVSVSGTASDGSEVDGDIVAGRA